MSSNKIERLYKGSDSYLELQGPLLLASFIANKAAFIAKNIAFSDPYAANWQTAINTASTQIPGRVVTTQLEAKTITVEEKIAECKTKYIDVIYFAQIAFGKKSTTLKEFGKGKPYNEAGKSTIKMFDFMDKLSQVANNHKTALIAAGYTQALINDIATLRDALNTDHLDQAIFDIGRPALTDDRLNAYNADYTICREVITAAKIIFKTDLTKKKLFQYEPPMLPQKPKIDIPLFNVPGSTTQQVCQIAYRADRHFNLYNKGQSPLEFFLSIDGINPVSAKKITKVGAGKKSRKLSSKLAASGNFLMVRNPLITPGGSGEAKYEQ